jgi:hypothetical protein
MPQQHKPRFPSKRTQKECVQYQDRCPYCDSVVEGGHDDNDGFDWEINGYHCICEDCGNEWNVIWAPHHLDCSPLIKQPKKEK